MKRRRRIWIGTVAVLTSAVAVLSLASCSPTRRVSTDAATTLDVAYSATSFTQNFNPLTLTNPSEPVGTQLWYESLIRYSPTNGFAPTPWLATSWQWSDGGKTLTWQLRHGVTWSDGQPFTSADVKFTINLIKPGKFRAQPPGPITTVDTPNPHEVVVHYSAPAYATFGPGYYHMYILPEHIWAKQNANTWLDPRPVGTGPFVLQHYGLQRLTLAMRKDYWGGVGKGVKYVVYNASATSNGILQELLTGGADYAASALIGDPQKTFVDQGRGVNHFWLPSPGAGEALLFNNAVAPTNDVNVRRAIYAAIDAAQIVTLTPGQFASPGNVTGLNEPAYSEWIAPQYRSKIQKQDPDAARAALKAGGWTVENGRLTKDGKSYPLSIKAAPTDPVQWVPAIAGQLKKVLGLDVATDISVQNANSAQEGRFTLAVGPDVPGQSAQAGLNWMTVAPTKVGESANTGNWARADSPQAQALVARMSATNSIAAQQKLAYQIEEIMVDQRFTAPIAPYSWSIAYTSRRWTNWPSQQNYYAVPENGLGDLITTILNLTPTAAVSQDSS